MSDAALSPDTPDVDKARRSAGMRFTAADRLRLVGYYGFIVLLHVVGVGLFLHYSVQSPSLTGLGLAAYLLGLRHAFDADHIAAVDDTVRYLLQKGQQPLGVGFFFSLGHASVVFALALAAIFAASAVREHMPALQEYGGIIGSVVSGSFLWLIGILNLFVLLDILQLWKHRSTAHGHTHVEQLLARRGFINRLIGGHLQRFIRHSWQMYIVGVLFGLGFDTATEIGLLAMSAGAATGDLPIGGALSLPILFAAGMAAMDTTDGVLMTKAYNWAFVNPLRKVFYNLATTSLSIVVALVIGSVELAQVVIELLDLHGPLADAIAGLGFESLGYVVVALFLVAWGVSAFIWRTGRFEERADGHVVGHHEHAHTDIGVRHSHRHIR